MSIISRFRKSKHKPRRRRRERGVNPSPTGTMRSHERDELKPLPPGLRGVPEQQHSGPQSAMERGNPYAQLQPERLAAEYDEAVRANTAGFTQPLPAVQPKAGPDLWVPPVRSVADDALAASRLRPAQILPPAQVARRAAGAVPALTLTPRPGIEAAFPRPRQPRVTAPWFRPEAADTTDRDQTLLAFHERWAGPGVPACLGWGAASPQTIQFMTIERSEFTDRSGVRA